MSDENNAVRIQGTLLGHPVDVTVTECEAPAPDSDQSRFGVEAEASGEVIPKTEVSEAEAADTKRFEESQVEAEAPVEADPAPAPVESTDEPKNPAGNAEQL